MVNDEAGKDSLGRIRQAVLLKHKKYTPSTRSGPLSVSIDATERASACIRISCSVRAGKKRAGRLVAFTKRPATMCGLVYAKREGFVRPIGTIRYKLHNGSGRSERSYEVEFPSSGSPVIAGALPPLGDQGVILG